jgi:glycosyltransferase involved in cell wall biosynthesis
VVFIGELRHLKGVDVLLDALAILAREGRPTSATIIGTGPDAERFRSQAEQLGLGSSIHFLGAMPARDGFARGRVMVAPSRAESLPYIVLEAAAAAVPLITTNVGGIPEVFGPQSARLIPPSDPTALASALGAALADPANLRNETLTLRTRVQAEFSADVMADAVLAAYAQARQFQTK